MNEKTVPDTIKRVLESTYNNNVQSKVGEYAGVFSFDDQELVSSTDGVGTKIIIACNANNGKYHNVIGQDLVNHCVNDILVTGAEPLFFLNTFSYTDEFAGYHMLHVMKGMAKAARAVDMPIISGETAKLQGFYTPNIYDLSGTIVGWVNSERRLPKPVSKGDYLIGVRSSGPHTNGFTLIREIFCSEDSLMKAKQAWDGCNFQDTDGSTVIVRHWIGMSVEEACMQPHRCYYNLVRPMLDKFVINAIAHITGKGMHGNLERVVGGADYSIDWPEEKWSSVFKLIKIVGGVTVEKMWEEFNLGIGLILVVAKDDGPAVLSYLQTMGEDPVHLGVIL
jgi:phosphoribosylformylglycinamidine cyclo-ligase